MRNHNMIAMAATALSIAGTAFGQVCETTFTGQGGSSIWQNPTNWTNNEPPTSTRVACIPANFTVYISDSLQYNPDAHAEAIVLEGDPGDPTTGATLILSGSGGFGTSLTLYANSRINGRMVMSTHSRLSIADNLTIAGDGGEIEGLPGEDAHAFAIIESPSDKTLTIVGGGIPREESLLLRGSFDVRVRLANRAYVIADKKDPLILSTLPKLKHGPDAFFIAEAENGDEVGRLLVNVEVSGAGTWLLADHPSCKIVFNAPCTKLFGNFQVEKGTLEINQNFATRGNLYFRSVDDSTPAIQVAEGVIADFSQ